MGNLNLDQMTAGQTNKNVTSNDADEQLDKAITESVVLDFTSGDITLTAAQFRENFMFECDNVPAPRVLNLPTSNTIKRFFVVSVQDDESFSVTVTNDTGESVVAPGATKVFYTDGTVNDLRDIEAGGGAGAPFIDLADVDPSSYTNQEGKIVVVNQVPDGLEFVSAAESGSAAFSMFQGLLMGTRGSPGDLDAGKFIHVDRLKVAVFDDGAFVNDVTDLELDTSASGAVGQLDTGSLATGTWYEIYLIGRSDTGAVGLLGTLAEDWDTDQSGVSDDADFRLRNSTDETNGAQSFQPSATSPLLYVDLKLQEAGSVPSNKVVWLTVEADNAGDPSGTPLATSVKLRADLMVSDEPTIIKFAFPVPAVLTAATSYWIVIHADYIISVTNHLIFRGNTTTSYADGLAKDFDGASTWSTPTDGSIVDFWFRTHMGIGGNNPSLPSPYDRQVKLGYFRSQASAIVDPFRAMDKTVQYHGLHVTTFVQSSGARQELIDLVEVLPPSMVNAELKMRFGGFSGAANEIFFSGVPYGVSDITKGAGAMENDPQYSNRRAMTYKDDSQLSYLVGSLFTEGQAIYASCDAASTVTIMLLQYTWV